MHGVSLSSVGAEGLEAFSVERPKLPGETVMASSYALDIEGWALGREHEVQSIRGTAGGSSVFDVPLAIERPDVAAMFPGRESGATCGFRVRANALRLPLDFDLHLRAVLDNGTAVEVARVQGRRAALATSFDPLLQPLILTSVARSGTTILQWALSGHPSIVSYRPFLYEARVANYWLSVLLELSNPGSFVLQMRPRTVTSSRWWLGDDASGEALPDAGVERSVGYDAVVELAEFCQKRIEAVYREVAAELGQKPAYFVEGGVPALAHELYPRAREIMLVRDFRDVVCSRRSYNERLDADKRFGGDPAQGQADFLRRVKGGVSRLMRAWEARRDTAHLVRYEDLVLQPERTLTDVLNYVELPRTGLDDMVTRLSAEEPDMARHRTTESAESSIGRWKRDLDPEIREACEKELGPALEAFGYET